MLLIIAMKIIHSFGFIAFGIIVFFCVFLCFL